MINLGDEIAYAIGQDSTDLNECGELPTLEEGIWDEIDRVLFWGLVDLLEPMTDAVNNALQDVD